MRYRWAYFGALSTVTFSVCVRSQQTIGSTKEDVKNLPNLTQQRGSLQLNGITLLPDLTDISALFLNLTQNPDPGDTVGIGGQDFTHCCVKAVYYSLGFTSNGTLVTTTLTGSDNSHQAIDQSFLFAPFSCGATYNGSESSAAVNVTIPYLWCYNNCPGWQRFKTTKLTQWVSPFTGFVVPAVVFCLAIPRRRKLWIPEVLFAVPLNETMALFRIPIVAIVAALLVTIDTVLWLMVIFALTGPILLSGIYEAFIDNRVLTYMDIAIKTGSLDTKQRARILYTMLIGNLDILTVPPNEEATNTPWNHLEGLLRPLDDITHMRINNILNTKTRLRTMLSAQYSFGVTVGAPVVFFGASFVYTLVDNYNNYGNNDTSHAIAFGEYWQTIPHIAIISGLLLAGNNPNILEGVVGKSTVEPEDALYKSFALVYDSRYRPAWIWHRGRSKKIWFQAVCREYDDEIYSLKEDLKMNWGDWFIVGSLAYVLIVIPALLAFLTAWYTPQLGLSCRSMTVLVYMLCQACLIALWVWDIEFTNLDPNPTHNMETKMAITKWGERRNFSLVACVWYPFVTFAGACATFAAIGGTMMQIMGVYHNCLCLIPLSQWGRSSQNVESIIISDNSIEDIHYAKNWWKGTGAGAIAFLGVVAFVGWWYQKRIRFVMKQMIQDIDKRERAPRELATLQQHNNALPVYPGT